MVEQSCVVWASSITTEEENSLERTQKCALRLIFKEKYQTYSNALILSGLSTLSQRRLELSYRFALSCTKNEKTRDMFPLKKKIVNTRHTEQYVVPFASTSRLANSAIPAMAKLLNQHNQSKKSTSS